MLQLGKKILFSFRNDTSNRSLFHREKNHCLYINYFIVIVFHVVQLDETSINCKIANLSVFFFSAPKISPI